MVNNADEGVSHEEQFISNLFVDTLDDRFQRQRFAVEFAFLRETTVDTVLGDLEAALEGMGLRLAIPRHQCALAYDSSGNPSTNMNDTLDSSSNDGMCSVDDANVTVLSGTDCIYRAPSVAAFYDLNRRCGLSRVSTFFVVRRPVDLHPSRRESPFAREAKGVPEDGKHSNAVATAVDGRGGGGGGLSVYLLQRRSKFDKSSNALLTFAVDNTNDEDDKHGAGGGGGGGCQSALARVREMVAAEEQLILASRRQQQHPPREPHWSLKMNQPPSRLEWVKALEAEAAAYERLNAQIAHATSTELARQAATCHALEREVTQLHERIDGMKINVEKRQVLQERVDHLKTEMEAQREKEHELLQELERVKTRETKQSPPPPPSGVPPSFRLYAERHAPLPSQPSFPAASSLMQQDGRVSPQHRTPLRLENGVNYSAIHASTGGTGVLSGSHFLSPSIQEEVRRALSPRGSSPASAQQNHHHHHHHQQQQQQQSGQGKQTDLQRLRRLAVELSQHLRSPNPNVMERRRLMNEIRTLREEVEQQEVEKSRIAVSSLQWREAGSVPS